jgi:Ca-activated chloride channel family protein
MSALVRTRYLAAVVAVTIGACAHEEGQPATHNEAPKATDERIFMAHPLTESNSTAKPALPPPAADMKSAEAAQQSAPYKVEDYWPSQQKGADQSVPSEKADNSAEEAPASVAPNATSSTAAPKKRKAAVTKSAGPTDVCNGMDDDCDGYTEPVPGTSAKKVTPSPSMEVYHRAAPAKPAPMPAPMMAPASRPREAEIAVIHPASPAAKSAPAQPPAHPVAPTPPPAEETPTSPQPIASVPVIARTEPFPDTYFQHFGVNPTYETTERGTSTFSVDVDTASYTLTRSYIGSHVLPDEAAVRVEEFVNAFDYGYTPPTSDPIALAAEAFPSPNRRGYHVLQIGLKARELPTEGRRPLHLVFVIDTSGSMLTDNRIGLVRNAIKLLVDTLDERDTVGIVDFNNSARVDIETTSATDRARIFRALDGLYPGGSTNVEAGIRLGYRLANSRAEDGGVHRVVLLSDGVANEGITEADAIFDTVREEAQHGVTVTTIGVGQSNFNDVLLNRFAQLGRGNYFFLDSTDAARRLFVEDLAGTLQPVARDVKVQVVFDPQVVARYRLLGYESRTLTKREFDNDHVDGGEMGIGHSVTAIYEVKIVKVGVPLGTLRIRYKPTTEGAKTTPQSKLLEKRIVPDVVRGSFEEATPPARLALVAASFAEKLRRSYWARNLTYSQLEQLWREIGEPLRLRKDVEELGSLIREAEALDHRGDQYERDIPVARMDFDHLPVLQ